MNNRDKLIEIMVDKKLERREIAAQLHVDRDTVDHWLAPTESSRVSQMPDMALELLEIKLGICAPEIYVPEASR
ncbi:MAG: hypothetical protein ACU84Q_10480 [Gammaproteobacteria bacterium]